MFEWLSSMENTKPLALVIFFVTFVGILFYVFTGKKRSERLESYKNIPFLEDEQSDKLNKKDQDNG
ncbi:MAG: cbb3-type cytochrome oxidase subunit 3 [Sedimenticolaceae bacterium]|jgi:cbb3-type cytochrome oxidase subunit 3